MEEEIYYENTTSLEVNKTNVKTEYNITIDGGFAVRTIKDKRIGFGYGETKEKAKNNAIKTVKYSKMANYVFPSIEKNQHTSTKKESDGDIILVAKEVIEKIENKVSEFKDVGIKQLSFEMTNIKKHVENSNGLDIGWSENKSSLFLYLTKGDREISRSLYIQDPPTEKEIEDVIEECIHLIKKQNKKERLDKKKYVVMFSKNILPEIYDFLLYHLNHKTKIENQSSLEYYAEQIKESGITMIDSPLLPGPNARPYDDEGIPSEERKLIKNGVIKNYYSDMQRTAIDNENATIGFCYRGDFRTPLIPHVSNVNVEMDVKNEVTKYLLIEEWHGFHTMNISKGDFSCTVTTAFLVKDDQMIATKPFSISGNVFNMFSSIKATTKKKEWMQNYYTQNIVFSGVEVVP